MVTSKDVAGAPANAAGRTGIRLLWIDCAGGLIAGGLMFALHPWLAVLFALPEELLRFIATANLVYGSYSLSLVKMPRLRTLGRIRALAIANMLWGVGCMAMGAHYLDVASPFGLLQLFGEGVFVGGLGMVEWQARERLVLQPADATWLIATGS